MTRYEVTLELPNGDWRWHRFEAADFHEMCEQALAYATTHPGSRVHHLQKLPTQ